MIDPKKTPNSETEEREGEDFGTSGGTDESTPGGDASKDGADKKSSE